MSRLLVAGAYVAGYLIGKQAAFAHEVARSVRANLTDEALEVVILDFSGQHFRDNLEGPAEPGGDL